MIGQLLTLLFWLMVGHALADFPLQGEYLSQAKRHDSRYGQNGFWFFALTAHALIHAAMVGLAIRLVFPQLGNAGTAVMALEFVWHWSTDLAKARGAIGMKTDQLFHFTAKGCWVILVYYMVANV